jgi:hypothetical protein
LLALEQLVESLIENQEGKRAIGLVFVERRITAMALHCYFSYERDELSRSGDWLSAVQARCRLRESELFRSENAFEDSGDNFEDSMDDPLTVNSPHPNRKRKVAQMDEEERYHDSDETECQHHLGKHSLLCVDYLVVS